jgi:PAS domain S-box-containing protein
MPEQSNSHLNNLWITWVLLSAALAATTVAVFYVKTGVEADAKRQFDFACNEIHLRIDSRMEAHAQILRSAAAHFGASDKVTREQWHEFTTRQKVDQTLPGILGIGFSLVIPRERLAEHTQEIRAQGFPDYNVRSAGDRAFYTSIIYLEPFSGRNLRAFGYDMFSESVRREAMEQSRDLDVAAVSGKVVLVQETDKDVQAGMLMYVPVYRKGMPSDTTAHRREALYGWVYSPYRMNDLMQGMLRKTDLEAGKRIRLEVFDDEQLTPNSLLYDSQRKGEAPNASQWIRQISTAFNGHLWQLRFTQMDVRSNYSLVYGVLLVGMIIALLLFGLFRSLLNTNSKARQMADRLTVDLRESEQSYRNQFANNSSVMLMLDPADGGMIGANAAAVGFYGHPQERLLAMGIGGITTMTPSEVGRILASVSQEQGKWFESQHRLADGSVRDVEVSLSRIQFGGRFVLHAIIHDITERKRAKTLIQQANDRLSLAVRTSGVGIWDYDVVNNRLVWDNQMFRLYGIRPDQFAGAYEAWQAGLHPEDRSRGNDEIQKALRGEREFDTEFRVVWPDGTTRIIHALASVQRDGSGKPLSMVGINWDITDRKRAEESLQQQFRLQQLLMEISSTYINLPLEAVESTIQLSLGDLAKFVGADRAYIFDYDWHNQMCVNTHEWCSEGIAPQIDELQAVPLATLPDWIAAHRLGKRIYVPDVLSLPAGPLRNVLEPQGIKSLLAVPLMGDGECVGFVGFDSVRHHHVFANNEQRLLTVFSQMLVNIRRRKQASEKLRKLSQAVEFSPSMILITDRFGCVEYVNPAWERTTGYRQEEILGRRPSLLESGVHSREFYEKLWGEITAGRIWRGELCNRKKNGELFWEWTSIAPVRNEAGNITHFVAVKEDTTADKLVAEELRQAKETAESANRAKSTFLANMSHEIRTPMNAVLGFAQLMLRDPSLSAIQQQQLGTITSSGGHLLEIINDILEISRIESGLVTLSLASFDLHSTLDDLKRMFSLRARSRNLSLHVEIQGEVPRYILADETKLRQIAINVLGNAIKFTASGGAVIMRVRAAEERDGMLRLHMEVEDTGEGIAPEDITHLFEAFFQTHSGNQVAGGSGLGLPISRQFARLMGGDLTVSSQLGSGSTFRFNARVARGNILAATEQYVSMRRVLHLQPGLPACRVLAVDDELHNRELIECLLAPVGFEIRSACNGAEAVAQCKSWAPHLMLLDLRMPVMDGYEAARLVRAGNSPAPKIIALSACAFAHDRQRAEADGADDFIAKPFREAELMETIKRVLGVDYIYSDSKEGCTVSQTEEQQPSPSEEEIRSLPVELVDNLLKATCRADYNQMLALADQAVKHNVHLGQRLAHLVRSFDYLALQKILSPDKPGA